MTDEEIVAIVRGKAEGKANHYCVGSWHKSNRASLSLDGVYRLIPTYTPITVDWSVLNDDFKWIAADKNGDIYGHSSKPRISETSWDSDDYFRLRGIKSLKRGDIPWDQSLIKRPEDV